MTLAEGFAIAGGVAGLLGGIVSLFSILGLFFKAGELKSAMVVQLGELKTAGTALAAKVERFDASQQRIAVHEEQLREVDEIGQRQRALEERVSDLEVTTGRLEERVRSTEERLGSIRGMRVPPRPDPRREGE